MRDIRADLKERIELAEATAKAAIDQATLLRQMLAAEEARVSGGVPVTTGAHNVSVGGTGIRFYTAVPNVSLRHAGGATAAPVTGTPAPTLPGIPVAGGISLDEYLVRAVKRGVFDKDELRDGAIRAGYFKDSLSSPGRIVHARLTNLVRSGVLQKDGESFIAKEAAE